jgi:hypothetical protein
MTSDNDLQSSASAAYRHSSFWDISVPIAAAAVPAGSFALLGLFTSGFDKPGAEPPLYLIVVWIGLEVIGMIAMAVVILSRCEFVFKLLSSYTSGNPSAWRKQLLILSISCLLLFDVLTNVSVAFSGAGFLLVCAIPTFLTYYVCYRVAFVGLRR